MDWDEFQAAVRDARETVKRGDSATQQLANLLAGRLRASGVYTSTLRSLKRELRDFDMTTGRWKDKP